MDKTIMGAVVSLDGYIAMDNDDVGPLFDRVALETIELEGTRVIDSPRVTHLRYRVRR